MERATEEQERAMQAKRMRVKALIELRDDLWNRLADSGYPGAEVLYEKRREERRSLFSNRTTTVSEVCQTGESVVVIEPGIKYVMEGGKQWESNYVAGPISQTLLTGLLVPTCEPVAVVIDSEFQEYRRYGHNPAQNMYYEEGSATPVEEQYKDIVEQLTVYVDEWNVP